MWEIIDTEKSIVWAGQNCTFKYRSQKRPLSLKTRRKWGCGPCWYLGKSVLGGRHSQCKGPGVGPCLVRLKTVKRTHVSGKSAGGEGEEVNGGWIREESSTSRAPAGFWAAEGPNLYAHEIYRVPGVVAASLTPRIVLSFLPSFLRTFSGLLACRWLLSGFWAVLPHGCCSPEHSSDLELGAF